MPRGDEQTNDGITLAVVVERLDNLSRALESHDRQGREQFGKMWERINSDHDVLLELRPKVSTLEHTVIELAKVDDRILDRLIGQIKESRAWGATASGLATLASALAALVGLGKIGTP